MRRTKEEAEVTRQHLLKAALVVFSRKGYADTRLEDIAEEAEVTRGAIYHHFGGKVELYNTMLEQSYARVNPIMQEAIAGTASAVDGLRRLLVSTLLFAATDPDFRAITELTLFKTARVPELEEGLRRKIDATRGITAQIAHQIQVGIDTGEIIPTLSPFDAALTLLALQNGLLSIWLLDPGLFSLEDRAENLAEIFIQGIRVR